MQVQNEIASLNGRDGADYYINVRKYFLWVGKWLISCKGENLPANTNFTVKF